MKIKGGWHCHEQGVTVSLFSHYLCCCHCWSGASVSTVAPHPHPPQRQCVHAGLIVMRLWITVKEKPESWQNFDSLQSVRLIPAATATSNRQTLENMSSSFGDVLWSECKLSSRAATGKKIKKTNQKTKTIRQSSFKTPLGFRNIWTFPSFRRDPIKSSDKIKLLLSNFRSLSK